MPFKELLGCDVRSWWAEKLKDSASSLIMGQDIPCRKGLEFVARNCRECIVTVLAECSQVTHEEHECIAGVRLRAISGPYSMAYSLLTKLCPNANEEYVRART